MESSRVTRIGKWYTFAAAHQLYDNNLSEQANEELFGKCFRLHGHNYQVRVEVMSAFLEHGMVLNYYVLDDIVQEHVLNRYDHQFLNDMSEFEDTLTTAENLVDQIADLLHPFINRYGPSGHKANLSELEVREGERSYAIITY